jgi:RHS repeat-associated protein
MALRPEGDCTEWFGTAALNVPSYVGGTVVLEVSDGSGGWTFVEDMATSHYLSAAGEFLLQGSWATTLSGGPYRARIAATAFFGATGPLTSTQQAAWPSAQRAAINNTGSSFSCSQNPTITSVPPAAPCVGNQFSYQLTASNPANTGALQYAMFTAPNGATIGSGLIQWTPAQGQIGNRVYVVEAKNALGYHDLQGFALNVCQNANHPPEIVSEAVRSAHVGQAYAYDVQAVDPDTSDVLTYSLVANPTGMTIVPSTGVISWTPALQQRGVHQVTVRVTDLAGANDTQQYLVVVTSANRPPTFVSVPATTASRLQSYLYDADALDPDAADELLYSIELAPAGMTINPLSGLVSWTPAQNGTFGVTLRVEDPEGLFDEQSFAILVSDIPTNSAPSAGLDSYETAEDTALEIAAAGGVLPNDFDPENDPIEAVIDSEPEHGTLVLNPNGGLSYFPHANYNGTDVFYYRAREAGGSRSSAPARVQIVVAPSEDPPTIVTEMVRRDCVPSSFTYDVGAIDPDGTGSFTYAFVAAPSGATINSQTGLVSFSGIPQGTHGFTVEARDASNRTTTQTFSVVRCVAPPPSFVSVPPQAVVVGQPFSYPLTILEAQYYEFFNASVSSSASGVLLTSPQGVRTVEWTPTTAQVGTQTFNVGINHQPPPPPTPGTITQAFEIAVGGPGVTTSPPLRVRRGALYSYDVDVIDRGLGHTFELELGPAGMTIDEDTGVISWIPTLAQLGMGRHQNMVSVAVRDSVGVFGYQIFAVFVDPGAGPPEVYNFDQQILATVGDQLRYEVIAADEVPGALQYTVVSGPAGLSVGLTTGVIQWTPTSSQLNAQTARIRVRDTEQHFVEEDFSFFVRPANQPPEFTVTPPTTIAQGQLLDLMLSATDAEGDTLEWLLHRAPAGAQLNTTTGQLTFTSGPNQIGMQQFTVLVADDYASDSITFTIEVYDVNDAPILEPLASRNVRVYADLFVQVESRDPDLFDDLTFSLQGAPLGMTISEFGLIEYTPVTGQEGVHSITVRATDVGGLFDETALTVTVLESAPGGNWGGGSGDPGLGGSLPPIVSSTPPAELDEREIYTYLVEAFDFDTEGPLTYGLAQGPAGAEIDENGLLTWQTGPEDIGTHPFAVRVSSVYGPPAIQQFIVEVEDVADAPQIATNGGTQALVGQLYEYDVHILDPDPVESLTVVVTALPSGMQVQTTPNLRFTWTPVVANIGPNTLSFTVTDSDGLTDSQTISIVVSETNVAPTFESTASAEAFVGEIYTYSVEVTDANFNDSVTITMTTHPGSAEFANNTIRWVPSVTDVGRHNFVLAAEDESGAISTQAFYVDVEELLLPPDPATVATPLSQTGFTSFVDSVAFLYSGSPRNRLQRAMTPGSLDPRRLAVVRGRVLDRSGTPLPGVRVFLPEQPAIGHTLSRQDGRFDLAVNGGAEVLVRYDLPGYVASDRKARASWNGYAHTADVVLVPFDSAATSIAFGLSTSIQVARANSATDIDGTRRPTLIFQAGTNASIEHEDGSLSPASSLSIRATEFTLGESGPQAMPADLPLTTAYTHAVELSADEAVAVNARSIQFDQPVAYYVENFLNFPVGQAVPTGYYDRASGSWIGVENGRILRVLSVTPGLPTLDIDGSGTAASNSELLELGIDTDELGVLATLYIPGQSLWRSPVSHFTPLDCNWVNWCRSCEFPELDEPEYDEQDEDSCERAGSIIDCHDQVLGEEMPVAGTALSLNYRSNRVPGRKALYTIDIPITQNIMPPNVRSVEVEVEVAGRTFRESFTDLTPNQNFRFVWDGLDAYSRTVNGAREAKVRVGYDQDSNVGSPSTQTNRAFGVRDASVFELRASRNGAILWQEPRTVPLGTFQAEGLGFGAWSLSSHHVFDPKNAMVYFGDGDQKQLTGAAAVYAGIGQAPPGGDGGPALAASIIGAALATDAAGNLYIAEGTRHSIRKVTPDGVIQTIAGTGVEGFSGDGGLATVAELDHPYGIAVDRRGNVYFSDTGNKRIRMIGLDGRISTVVGTGDTAFNGHVQHAHTVNLGNLSGGLAINADGELFLTENIPLVERGFIRKVLPNGPDGAFGLVITIAGGGEEEPDEVFAPSARLWHPWGIAFDSRGAVYFADSGNGRVHRIDSEGFIHTIAGGGTHYEDAGDGRAADSIQIGNPVYVAVDSNDDVYFTETLFSFIQTTIVRDRLRKIDRDGIISTVAGGGVLTSIPNRRPGTPLVLQPFALAMDANDRIYVGDKRCFVYRFDTKEVPAGALAEVPSSDGSIVYRFNAAGQHIDTISTLTALPLLSFDYDANGLLSRITDVEGDRTTVERNINGLARFIVGPDGHRTELEYDSDDYLEVIRDPLGAEDSFEYSDDGLLEVYTDPRGTQFAKVYDDQGLLVRDENPFGYQGLARTPVEGGHEIAVTSAMGHVTRYRILRLDDGNQIKRTISPSGVVTESIEHRNGELELIAPDGTRTVIRKGPDPRFGMDVPLAVETRVTSPAGLEQVITLDREVDLEDPADPLSLRSMTDTVAINGRTATRTFTAATRTWFSVSAAGRESTTVLDAFERESETQSGELLPVTKLYDGRGRVASQTQSDRSWTFAYDQQGFLQSHTDPLNRTDSYERDAVGRVTLHRASDLSETQYRYDISGNTTSVQPPSRPEHLFNYDVLGRELAYTPPQVGSTLDRVTRTFNADGDPVSVTDPDGHTITFSYHSNGQLWSAAGPRSYIHYTYDGTSGQIRTIINNAVTLSLLHDGALPTRTTISSLVFNSVVERTFDDDFRLGSVSVNGETPVEYGYDPDGLILSAGQLTLAPRVLDGLLATTNLGSIADVREYSNAGEPTGFTARFGSLPFYQYSDDLDDMGRVELRAEVIGSVSRSIEYRYDLVDRLHEVLVNGALAEIYEYDTNGNRVSRTIGGTTISSDVDAQDRVARQGTISYGYSGLGQIISRTDSSSGVSSTLEYDDQGNIVAYEQSDGMYATYVVDGLNRRIARDTGDDERFWVWDANQLVAEVDDNGQVTQFVYATSSYAADFMIRGSNTYRFVRDQVGSIRLVVHSATGEIAQRIDYDSFGRVLLDTNPGFQPFGFIGGLYDPLSRLVRLGARDYDPELGRFISRDSLGFAGTNNEYVYADNDPINSLDPSGNISFLATLAIGALIDGGIDLALQMMENGGRFSCIDWGRVGKEIAAGAALNAAGVGLLKAGSKFAKLGKAAAAACKLCLAPDTMVETIDGPRAIADISVGDLVLSMHEETGELAWKPVTEVYATPDRPLVEVLLVGKGGASTSLRTTPDHPFWGEGDGWIGAGELTAGSRVWTLDTGWSQIAAVRTLDERAALVLNLEVGDHHTFFIGDAEAWVHNCKGGTYQLVQKGTGDVVNVVKNGRTNNLVRRKAELLRKYAGQGYEFITKSRTDDYAAQRGIEEIQLLTERGPLDRISGIAANNPNLGEFLQAGASHLVKNGGL